MTPGKALSKDPFLAQDSWEWCQVLALDDGRRMSIICCPEDVERCDHTQHEGHVICSKCAIPLCCKCHLSLDNKKHIPMALANNNYIGYASETLVRYKVRFIEVAIVCPVWTSLICFYLEEDRGHLMKEGMHAARHRNGVRGNNFPFLMPWKDIVDSLHRVEQTKDFLAPHPPEVLARVVRLHMKLGE